MRCGVAGVGRAGARAGCYYPAPGGSWSRTGANALARSADGAELPDELCCCGGTRGLR